MSDRQTGPTNPLDWAWGVDVRTGLIAFGALSTSGDARWWSIDTQAAAEKRGAARLSAIRAQLAVELKFKARRGTRPQPTAIVVENPTIVRTDFRLLTAVGVTMEVLFSLYRCPVLELPTSSWKLEVLGKGNAGKPQIMDHAHQCFNYDGDSQDEADALCIAAAGLSRVRTLQEAA